MVSLELWPKFSDRAKFKATISISYAVCTVFNSEFLFVGYSLSLQLIWPESLRVTEKFNPTVNLFVEPFITDTVFEQCCRLALTRLGYRLP